MQDHNKQFLWFYTNVGVFVTQEWMNLGGEEILNQRLILIHDSDFNLINRNHLEEDRIILKPAR